MQPRPSYRVGYTFDDDLSIVTEVRAYVTDGLGEDFFDEAKRFNGVLQGRLERFNQMWPRGSHVLVDPSYKSDLQSNDNHLATAQQ